MNTASAEAGLAAAADAALTALLRTTRATHVLVAYSGGRDSTVLLDLVSRYAARHPVRVSAVHVEHGLHAAAPRWAHDCRAAAVARGLPCLVLSVQGVPPAGASVEAWARDQRYAALAAHCDAATLVVTAHHAEDQRETVLQRALSGAGPHGLAGMPRLRRLGAGYLGRPLLECPGAALAAYARARGLTFVDDPSNADDRFLRNRLRHDILPELERAVPGARAGLSRLGAIQRDLADGLDALADALLERDGLPVWQVAVATLSEAGEALVPYVLRRALTRAGYARPGQRQLLALLGLLGAAGPRGMPAVRWRGQAVRRYREHLYFTPAQLPSPPPDALSWSPARPLTLPWGVLTAATGSGPAMAADALSGGQVRVRFRRGGERCRLPGRVGTHALKKLFQDWAVPPWERALLPLVEVNGELAAIGDRAVTAAFAAPPGEGVVLTWRYTFYATPDTTR